jgi:hypothetical protein
MDRLRQLAGVPRSKHRVVLEAESAIPSQRSISS